MGFCKLPELVWADCSGLDCSETAGTPGWTFPGDDRPADLGTPEVLALANVSLVPLADPPPGLVFPPLFPGVLFAVEAGRGVLLLVFVPEDCSPGFSEAPVSVFLGVEERSVVGKVSIVLFEVLKYPRKELWEVPVTGPKVDSCGKREVMVVNWPFEAVVTITTPDSVLTLPSVDNVNVVVYFVQAGQGSPLEENVDVEVSPVECDEPLLEEPDPDELVSEPEELAECVELSAELVSVELKVAEEPVELKPELKSVELDEPEPVEAELDEEMPD